MSTMTTIDDVARDEPAIDLAPRRAGGRRTGSLARGARTVPLTPDEAAAVALFIDAGLLAAHNAPVAATVDQCAGLARPAAAGYREPVVA